MIKANLHTHSLYCDGKASVEEVIKMAIEKKFDILGFSSHAPVPFENHFSVKNKEALQQYAQEVRECKKKYSDVLDIYLSLEIDYIPGITTPFQEFKDNYGLDYTIGSVHLIGNVSEDLWFIDGSKQEVYDDGLRRIFGGDIQKGVKAYYHQLNAMITTQKPDMIGHMDKIKMHNKDRYFKEDEPWYVRLVDETLDYIKANDVVMEVNTRGIYRGRCDSLFPGVEILKKALKMNIPICLNSDAHKPEELEGYYPEARKILKEIGFNTLVYFEKGSWKDFALEA